MAKTWRRVSKDERQAYGRNKRRERPRNEDFKQRGKGKSSRLKNVDEDLFYDEFSH